MSNPFLETLTTNLGCEPDTRVAIVSDDGPFAKPTAEIGDRASLANTFVAAAESAGMQARFVGYENLGRSGIEPPRNVFAAVYPDGFVEFAESHNLLTPLLDKTIAPEGLEQLQTFVNEQEPAFDVMLVLSRYSVSHTRFRKLLSGSGRVRAATMPGVEPYMFNGVMTADWALVARRSQRVATLLSAASRVELETAGGRCLTLSLEGRTGLADTGLLTQPGAFGNLPGGEAFIAPVEGTAQGALSVGPRENPAQWAFEFSNGRLDNIIGEPPFAKRLEQAINEYKDVRNVAELGIGTNEKASAPDNTLEAEKILGTAHLALGDNASFGGEISVPFHQDYVAYQPTLRAIEADGTVHTILQDGNFLAEP